MRWSIRSQHLHGIAAVRQKAGVTGISLVAEIFFQQQPSALAIAAIVDGIHKLIVVIIVRAPLSAGGWQLFHGAGGTELRATPARKTLGVEHLALVRSFILRPRPQDEKFP